MTFAFSPCPNDTYTLYALIHGLVECNDITFEPHLADVEELNEKAVQGTFGLTKISFRAWYDVSDNYDMLSTGAALGHGSGPLLISKKAMSLAEAGGQTIAVPGMRTTATFLLQSALSSPSRLVPVLFSDIEGAILNEEVDAGVIIHETRFLYEERGLTMVADLGNAWEKKTNLPIPLGGFIVKKALPDEVKQSIARVVRQSIAWADDHYDEVLPYIKDHSTELSDEVIRRHIQMFVNEYSRTLGRGGRAAIQTMFDQLNEMYKTNRVPVII